MTASLALVAGLAVASRAASAQEAATAGPTNAARSGDPDWTSAGQNIDNTRYAQDEHVLSPGNVSTLTPRWTLKTGGDVPATPTVSHGVVYVPDLGGNLWAVDAATGAVIWKTQISDYTGIAGDTSRNSPAVFGHELVIGNGTIGAPVAKPGGAYLIGINARTGAMLWKVKIDDDNNALVTGSPVVADGIAYVGVSSTESGLPSTPHFRGSVVAVDATTGQLLWKSYVVPEGYTGGAVWGSTPVIDPARGLLYVGTGQNYSVPPGVCQTPTQTGCTPPAADDDFDSIVAMNLATGQIAWADHTLTADTWSRSEPVGLDYDFGSGPNLYTAEIDGHPRQLLGIGQKSGTYWAVDPGTGKVVWSTNIGPGGIDGGIQWGSAVDGSRIYAGIGDLFGTPYQITSASGVTTTIKGGSVAAIDAATGRIEWQVADPQGAPDIGFISTANGVVYVPSIAATGNNMYALDAADGSTLWAFPSGGAVISGAAIVNGSVYWGSGYYIASNGTGSNSELYAFSLPTDAAKK
jgi:polyvinyl alcohol dehydrogenase (cytochrome)